MSRHLQKRDLAKSKAVEYLDIVIYYVLCTTWLLFAYLQKWYSYDFKKTVLNSILSTLCHVIWGVLN
jgi:hypothetical protein